MRRWGVVENYREDMPADEDGSITREEVEIEARKVKKEKSEGMELCI